MAFVDELKIHLQAGRGGNGVVRWRHEKGKEFSGASGGNGGKGGNVLVRAIRDIAVLARYRNTKEFKADNGAPGMRDSKYGKHGEDIVIEMPLGALITNLSTDKTVSLEEDGQEILLLKGGNGGLGNEHFKASTNTSPKEWTPGKNGEEADFEIELQLFADVGLVGFPNAGKSSLLNALSNARAKVASYEFTTLEPNLGDMEGFIIADIPGLIEGAADGKGLGHKFLRHIKRTKALLHCISLENENIKEAHKIIRAELGVYDESLSEKPEYIVLTKTDLVDQKTLAKKIKEAEKLADKVLTVSIIDDAAVKKLKDNLIKILRK